MWPQQDYKWRDLCSALHRHRKHYQAHAERMGPWSSAWLWYKPDSRSVRVSHRPLQRYNPACLATRRSKLSGRDALPTQTCTQRVHPSLGSHGQGPPSSCSSSSLYSWSRHVQLQSLLQVTKTIFSGPPVPVTFSIIVQYLFFVSILSPPLPLPLVLCPLPHTLP